MSRRHHALVVMAASAGGVQALQKVLSGLPRDFPLPIAVVQHRTGNPPNLLARVLGRHTALTVKNAEDGERMRAGTVYLAPPREHLVVRPDESLALINGRKIRHLRSSANPLFASAAQVYGDGVIAVVLTGGDRDATDGVQSVRQHGGIVIAQDEATSAMFAMPRAAIQTGAVHAILPLPDIAPELLRLALLHARQPASAVRAVS
jgi:two-component system, chemotaxis family, protein-glutamate methylesterase/glutaminase